MKKALFLMLLFVALLFGGVFAFKAFKLAMQKKFIKEQQSELPRISATKANTQSWSPQLKEVGSLRSYKGVNVTTQAAGMVTNIYFNSGDYVKKGQLLVALNTQPEVAKLHELQANAEYAKTTYFRDKKQFAFGAISQQKLDEDKAQYESTASLVEEQKATIALKLIRAPFSGMTGISPINPGQYINPGDLVVNLQTLDPIYVDFFVPQQKLGVLHLDQTVRMTLDRAPGKTFKGKITTINPMVDADVRNAKIEATLANPNHILLPGMFSNVTFYIGKPEKFISIPYAAVTFNPYGALVYILKKTKQTKDGKPVWQANQSFIKTGQTRGEQIAVTKGIKVGDMIVTSGQLKLRNHSLVIINNDSPPGNKASYSIPEHN